MSVTQRSFLVRIHEEAGEPLWAEVEELPGCFASGETMEELLEALAEAISFYLSEPGHEVRCEVEDEPGSVTEKRLLVTC